MSGLNEGSLSKAWRVTQLYGTNVLGILLFTALSTSCGARDPFEGNSCYSRLRMIEGAKVTWMKEHHKTSSDVVTWDDIRPYLSHEGKLIPACPAGGTYTLGRSGEAPTCSIPGHKLN